MSIDWFVRWSDVDRSDDFMKPPTSKDIGEVLEDYFHGLYMDLTVDEKGHWTIKLKGTYSSMWARHGGRDCEWLENKSRYITVFVWPKKGIDVTVRQADDVTMGLAENFAKRCAQRWDGTVDEPS